MVEGRLYGPYECRRGSGSSVRMPCGRRSRLRDSLRGTGYVGLAQVSCTEFCHLEGAGHGLLSA